MSKIYKATIYIDDVNDMYSDIDNIKEDMERYLEDLTIEIDNVIEVDTTDYVDEVGLDNVEWNTWDKEKFIKGIEDYINKVKTKE